MRAMRILIANDDGYLAPGLAALVQACAGLGEIDVVAPEQNASGTSNALTLNRPLSVFEAAGERQKGFRVINGTPSDCVHVALTGLLPKRPDLVLSGINNGANMGDDTLYSGTVAAAMEGYFVRYTGDCLLAGAKGLGRVGRRGRCGAPGRRPGAGRRDARRTLAAEREHSQPGRCSDAAATHHPARPASCKPGGDSPNQSARRAHLLDRSGRRCARCGGRHRFPCHGERQHFDHAAAGRPD